MATKVIFNGRTIKLPGAYAETKSGIKNPSLAADYGKILVIDTGSGASFGGGAGIDGTLESGVDAIYNTDNISDFRNLMKGGLWWLLADPLFQPNGAQSNGVSEVYFAKAATTVPAELTYEFGDDYSDSSTTSDSDSTLDGGNFTLQVRDEGLIGNGALSGTNLYKGYAGKMFNGDVDTNKFIIRFYLGTWRGLDDDGDPYNNVTAANAVPLLIAESPEFSTMAELLAWMQTDSEFNGYFKLKESNTIGTGGIDAEDLTHYSDFNLASGGTEVYSSANLELVLEAVREYDHLFIISDQYGDDAQSVDNGKILTHIISDAKFETQMIVGGGKDSSKFTQTNGSIPTAQHFDSDRVIVVHGGIKKTSQATGVGFKEYDSIYKAAAILGRTCGLEPQIPTTSKAINIDGELHPLTVKEKEQCLDNGVCATAWSASNSSFQVIQMVNSLQNNNFLINEDGTTFSVQIRRISAQLNLELITNAERQLLNSENGLNRFTVSDKTLRDWTISYLKTRTVSATQDNLIEFSQNVTVNRVEDNKYVTYQFSPNGEITKLFFTSYMI